MMKPDFDLHIHTTASDGIMTPEEIVDIAVATKLKGIAITDHDTVAGLQPALDYIAKTHSNLAFVPGVELNTEYKGREVHILGYYFDFHDVAFNEKLAHIRTEREIRGQKIVERLNFLGVEITLEEVRVYAGGESMGRPHIGRVLVDHGYAESLEEAFDLYLGRGKPAYVPRYKFTPQEALSWIKSAGGITSLAHPGLVGDENIVDEVIAMGIDGIEVFHPQHTYINRKNYLNKAKVHGLLITGGSDFHGEGERRGKQAVGMNGVSMVEWQKLKNYKIIRAVARK